MKDNELKKNEVKLTGKVTSEDEIQHKIYVWFHNTYCLRTNPNRYMIFAVPNGGTRNVLEAIKLKNTGVLSGVSDLMVVLPQKTIFVELKNSKGVLSHNQMDFANRVKQLGHTYLVCRSLEEFQEMIKKEIVLAENEAMAKGLNGLIEFHEC